MSKSMGNISVNTRFGKLRTPLIWFGIDSVVGLIIAFFIYSAEGNDFWAIVASAQIVTHTIASPTAFVCYRLSKISGTFRGTLILTAAALFTTSASVFPAIIFLKIAPFSIRSYSLSSPWKLLLPSLLISLLFTSVASVIENLRHRRAELERGISELSLKKSGQINGISVRIDGEIRVIRFDEIIYFSSSGRKTVIHSEKTDVDIFQLLGDVEEKVPASFVRIHKRFIVNTVRISRMKYYRGGCYNLYLDDEDESILPVGKSYISNVKKYLKA